MKGAVVCCDQNSGEVAAVTQIGETIEECGELALLRRVPIAPMQSKKKCPKLDFTSKEQPGMAQLASVGRRVRDQAKERARRDHVWQES
jgi:hypothetical protein